MKRGIRTAQVTVFVIIALVIIAGVAGFFIVKNVISKNIPSSIAPVYDYYISCLQQTASDGAKIMGSQAGWLYPENFEPGSEYAPFSSQLAFMGLGVPYWYYLSSNGIKKEAIPTKKQMNEQLARYVKENINNRCDFSSFAGYSVSWKDASSVSVNINDEDISVSVNQELVIKKGEETFNLGSHKTTLDSKIGRFYNIAKKIYDYEKSSLFLENYSVDVLYNYAPVTGVELNCSPVVWSPYSVFDKIKAGLSANLGMLKVSGDYYTRVSDYFIVAKNNEVGLKNEQVSFLYSSSWPSRFEVWPTKNNLMIADPVGNQPGLSAMGFCYAPYKFVYDMFFPVLIQIYNPDDAQEIFEFPISVIIDKNYPRQALNSTYYDDPETICDKANAEVKINTFDINLKPVEADIEFKCILDSCNIGKTSLHNDTGIASLDAKVPQCVNGVIIAKSPGYKDKKYFISTNEESSADVILDREYKLNLEVYVDGGLSDDTSVLLISEKLDDNSSSFISSISYPLNKEVKLSQGNYIFELKVYRDGSLIIPGTTSKQCVNQPKAGILGLFGVEQENCFDINIPSQTLTNLLYAGGSVNDYLTPDRLENKQTIKIYANSVKLPSSLDEVETSYDNVEMQTLSMEIV